MSGGGGGVGGPTVSHEPGVRNEPLLIAGRSGVQLFVDVTGQQPAKTVQQLNQLIGYEQWSTSISRGL